MRAAASLLQKLLRSLWRGLSFAALASATLIAQVAEIPFLTGRVTDNAEVLSAESRERLSKMIAIHEQNTTNEIAILTVPSLESGSTEAFAARVFQSWKLGEKGKDNGVLVIVSPGDRRVRIEVGKGLQSGLSEMAAARIIRDLMAPRFNEGDYDKGLEDGIGAIISRLGTNESPQEAASEQSRPKKDSFFEGADMGLTERILIGAFIFGIIGLFTVIGVVTPGAGWFLYFFLIPFWAMFPIVVVGARATLVLLVIYLTGFPAAKLFLTRTEWYPKAKAQLLGKGIAHIGGFTVTGRGSSGFSWNSGKAASPPS